MFCLNFTLFKAKFKYKTPLYTPQRIHFRLFKTEVHPQTRHSALRMYLFFSKLRGNVLSGGLEMGGHADSAYESLGTPTGIQFLSHVLNIQCKNKIFMKHEPNIRFSHLRFLKILVAAG